MSPTSPLRLRSTVLALTLAAVVLAGCSTTTGVSAPTTGTTSSSGGTSGSCSSVLIEMRSGSVPAPYSYEWSLTLDGDQGSLTAQGGERGAEKWNRSFAADARSRAGLCAYATELSRQGPTDGVGGSTVHAEYTPDGGSPVSGENGVDGSAVPGRMAAALPGDVWSALDQQLEDWSNTPRTTATPTS